MSMNVGTLAGALVGCVVAYYSPTTFVCLVMAAFIYRILDSLTP